jgi:hypothetical protein
VVKYGTRIARDEVDLLNCVAATTGKSTRLNNDRLPIWKKIYLLIPISSYAIISYDVLSPKTTKPVMLSPLMVVAKLRRFSPHATILIGLDFFYTFMEDMK